MTTSHHDEHDVLEHNVSTLLETGGERPRIAPAARARIRAELIARHGAVASARRPLIAVGAGLAAMVAAALILGRLLATPEATPAGGDALQVAGAEIVRGPDARITALGARHLRVDGTALIDVAPGHGAFVVETAHGRIEVLGTRFLVDGAADRTTTAVVRGEVRLATDHGDVTLHAGEQGVAEAGRAPVRGPAPRLSQLVSWARDARHRDEQAAPAVHHGTLFARDPGVRAHPPWGEEYPLPITRLGVDVVIQDQVARVALDQTFHNAEPRALEGMYRFAIPPDAALQRLAMYVDGKLVESGVVERMAARRIYEQLVYRRIDPALLEWAGTGRLALRVYPIPAQQDKRLMVAYTQSLPKLYRDYTLAIPLPEVDQPVGALDVAVRVVGCAQCEVSSASHAIEVTRDGGDAIARYRRAGEKLGDSFVLHVRDPQAKVTLAEATQGGERYLMVRAPGELAAGPAAYRPRTWVILDDVSASRGRLELRAQADVIDALLRELDEQDRVAVVAFDVAARTRLGLTRVIDVDRHAVRQALAGEGGVGATDIGVALDAARGLLAGVAADDAMIVYLGDGVITSGARNLDALRGKLAGVAHFVGVGIGDAPDTQTLGGLAAATGGYATAIDLADDLGWRTFDLVAALHTARVTGLAATLVDAAGQPVAATVYLGSPQLADGEELELVARLGGGAAAGGNAATRDTVAGAAAAGTAAAGNAAAGNAEATPSAVELTGTLNGQAWHRTIALGATGAVPVIHHADAGYLPRLWAQRHIAARLLAKHEPVAVPPCASDEGKRGKLACATEPELRERRDEAIRQEVVALGKQYFLLSRHTSLLVLENDAMYAQYGVTKGSGETWAPYAMPRTIPVTAAVVPVPSNVADDAELVRAPLAMFYNVAGDAEPGLGGVASVRAEAKPIADGVFTRGAASELGGDLRKAPFDNVQEAKGQLEQPVVEKSAFAPAAVAPDASRAGLIGIADKSDPFADGTEHAKARRVTAGPLGLVGVGEGGGGKGFGAALGGERQQIWGLAQPMAARLVAPSDVAFDDLTGFVPALVQGADDAWRGVLAAGGGQPHTIEPAASALLAAARQALPSGVYRWGSLELAVDAARRIGWRRTTEAGLAETSGFDGAVWTRRYPELGLDVTRAVHADDIALALAALPVWIAEPGHYAAWFDVALRGPREIVLSRRVHGAPVVALVLQLDAQAHLIAITGAAGQSLASVTWAAGGPASARVMGEPVAVGFTAQPIADAVQWAQGGAAPGVVVDLPLHLPAYWQARRAAEAAGSPAWRHATHQHMAALAATGELATLRLDLGELHDRGAEPIGLGELVLASGGLALPAPDHDRDHDRALTAALATTPVGRYVLAGRAYRTSERQSANGPPRDGLPDGLIRGLWTLRAASADLVAERIQPAAARILAIGDRAPALRLVGAAALAGHWDTRGEAVRVWDAVAVGAYRNVARVAAARALLAHGDYEAGVDRVMTLVADLDLAALPPRLDGLQYAFNQARRGPAGWQLVWATWRDRVLAGDSFDHVMALLAAAPAQTADVTAILTRAADLAGSDAGKLFELARAAARLGLDTWAEARLRALIPSQPSHALYQLIAAIELGHGQLAGALGDLEAAQTAGAGDAIGITTVRAELGQLLAVASRLAAQSTGAARTAAVQRALAWGDRWRAIDPGNPEIDRQLGELLLAVGDAPGAWRQLSSTIERDPWSGAGYAVVADALERQGKIADALALWQQAIVIDQTDPTPRLRKAQALIALGRAAEGDAILGDIAHRPWHDMWSGVVYQARELLERGNPHARRDE